MEWIKKEKDNEMVKQLVKRFELDPLAASIFVRRGITQASDIFYYIQNNPRFLYSPFEFSEMGEAVDRIFMAIDEHEKVQICGDRDVDGITATTILTKALKKWGCEVSWSVPEGDDDYGLSPSALERFAEEGVTLLITVDCGISNAKEIDYANSLGMDVIVTDHHNPPENLPNALALLNPKLENSGYPYEHICGCAVAFKLVTALTMAKAPFYNRNFTLLDVREEAGTYEISAIRVRNLVEIDRIVETLVPGTFSLENSRLRRFLIGQELLVFEEKIQRPLLQACFGKGSEIFVTDMAPIIWEKYPALSGKSLFLLKEKSTLGRYQDSELQEIDIFFNLYLTYTLDSNPSIYQTIFEYIDFVALGTIADLMPLKNENRLFLKLGMEKINQNNLPSRYQMPPLSPPLYQLFFLKNLLTKPLSAIDIAWQITPLINATGRMGVPAKAIRFFLEEELPSAVLNDRAKEINDLNEERKKRASLAWDRFLPLAKRSYDSFEGKFLIIAGKEIDRGIAGNLANRLTDYFQVPVMVVAFLEGKKVGSLRSVGGLNVKKLLEDFARYFNDFGGHDYAAGFSMNEENWKPFLEEFSMKVNRLDTFNSPQASLSIDAQLPPDYMNPDLIKTVDLFAPYGEQNPPLNFQIDGATIEAVELMGKNSSDHVRLSLRIGSFQWVALFWNAASRVGIDFDAGDQVDCVFQFHRNYFRSQVSIQLIVQDMRRRVE